MSRCKRKKGKVIPKYVYNISIEFDFEKVKNLAKARGIEAILKCDGRVVEFKSKYDRWIMPVDSDLIRIYHETSDGKRHLQEIYWSYEFMLDETKEHDFFRRRMQGANRVDNVMYKFNNGMIPRFKVN